jgi:arylsulfatase A-like enzyme
MKNVILLTIDALRKDALGCYGNRFGLTPFIDSLKDESVIFTRAQAIGPYTEASFPGILASSYYLEYGKEKRLSTEKILISEVLARHGIATAAFHSNPYLSAYFGWDRGWNVFYDSLDVETSPEVPYLKGNVINKKANEWLFSYLKGEGYEPFFLWLHYMDVHEPYMPEKKGLKTVDPKLDISRNGMFDLFKDVLLKRDVSCKERVEHLNTLYSAKVLEMDCYVREFFDMLQRLGVLQNSVVIITSDHGDEFNEHGGLSHDGKMYSELIDVPLLITNYDRAKCEVCNALVSNVDIPPTVIHLFGIDDRAQNFEGQSLLPFPSYREKGCFGEAISKVGPKETERNKPIYFYRERDLKMIYREDDSSWEMYDLRKDPRELNNIVDNSSSANYLKGKLTPRIRRWEKFIK